MDKAIAEREILKAARKLDSLFKRRKFRQPSRWNRPYHEPEYYSEERPNCQDCGRLKNASSGLRCRECFQKLVRARYKAKVKAEKERIALNRKAFSIVVKRKGTTMKTKKQLPMTAIGRSTSGLRTALFEEMEALRNGNSNAQRARSVAMMANSILQSVQVEIEYHKYVKSNEGRIAGDPKVVALGTDISLAA